MDMHARLLEHTKRVALAMLSKGSVLEAAKALGADKCPWAFTNFVHALCRMKLDAANIGKNPEKALEITRSIAASVESDIQPLSTFFDKGDFLETFSSEELEHDVASLSLIHNWQVCGKKVYEISEGLAWQLINTEVRGLRVEDVAAPHYTFMVKIPNAMKEHLAKVYHGDDEIMLIGVQRNVKKRRTSFKWETYGCDKDIIIPRMLSFSGDESWDEPLTDMMSADNDASVGTFALNVCLYSTMRGADIIEVFPPERERLVRRISKAKGASKRRLRKRLESTNYVSLLRLGDSVELVKNVGSPSTKSHGTGRKLDVRFLVRGHWRNQPCGKGRRDRKLIFIEPFWKGPELGPIINKKHEVKGTVVVHEDKEDKHVLEDRP
jgi:hypothetical protein